MNGGKLLSCGDSNGHVGLKLWVLMMYMVGLVKGMR